MAAGADTFCYDPNGNMTSRTVDDVTYTLAYDPEHRLNSVTQGDQTTTFTYDADGRRVKRDTVTDTIVYVGSHYEVRFEEGDKPEDLDGDCLITVVDIMQVVARWGMTDADPDWDSRYDLDGDGDIDVADIMQVAAHWRETCEELAETVKYYTLGGRRVAMRKVPADPPGQVGTVYYLFSDHLGSSNVSYRADGQQTITQRYYPWGTIRPGPSNALPTDHTFTGQRLDESTGLMYYGARYYDPALGRFISADPIVPNPANPQDLNRYAYVRNNPLKYTDSTGHAICEDAECTRVVHPVSGKLIRIRPPQIDWASIPPVVRFIYNEMLTHARGGTVAQLRTWNTQCLSCKAPALPEVRSAAAMADAEARILAGGLFAWKVRQGGEWDSKPRLVKEFGDVPSTYWNQIRKGGPEYYYDVWGNIEYGYLGTAAAFSEGALLEGAGAEQFGSSIGYAIMRRDPGFLPKRTPGVEGLRAWDDPADQAGIWIGIGLWNTYNLTITPMDIIEAIEWTPGLTTYPPPQ